MIGPLRRIEDCDHGRAKASPAGLQWQCESVEAWKGIPIEGGQCGACQTYVARRTDEQESQAVSA